jgi:hypothetical protein
LVPYKSGTPAYRIQVKARSKACIHALSCVLQLRTSPPCRCGFRCCHVSYSPGPHLPTEVGSGAATWSMALDLASLPSWALVLPCVPWPWTSPPCRGRLWRCHVTYGSGSRLPTEGGSGAVMCLTALGEPRASRIKNGITALGTQLGALTHYQGVCKMCRHAGSS